MTDANDAKKNAASKIDSVVPKRKNFFAHLASEPQFEAPTRQRRAQGAICPRHGSLIYRASFAWRRGGGPERPPQQHDLPHILEGGVSNKRKITIVYTVSAQRGRILCALFRGNATQQRLTYLPGCAPSAHIDIPPASTQLPPLLSRLHVLRSVAQQTGCLRTPLCGLQECLHIKYLVALIRVI